ncbi:MAG: biotin/lipoyl-binding protein, partial [Pseudomonadota bacterium]
MSDRDTRRVWRITFPAAVGFTALFILVVGLGVWSIGTQLAGAIISQGVIEVQSNRQVVEHPDGGVVGGIFVRDGDTVESGDLLLRLDDTFLASEKTVVEAQLFELLARQARLEAERDGAASDQLAEKLRQVQQTHSIQDELIAGQQRLFDARIETLDKQTEQLTRQKTQIESEIDGTQAQLVSLRRQVDLIR